MHATARPPLARLGRDLVAAWPAVVLGVAMILSTPDAPWKVFGPLSAALVFGLVIRALRDRFGRAPGDAESAGLRLYATTVLRIAVVVTALRLDWGVIADAGPGPWVVALTAVLGGLAAFALLRRWLGLRGPLVTLIAIGTSVCGAAAITAAAKRVNATDEEATIGIAIVSVLGAAASILFVIVHAVFGLDGELYALLSGGSLHEVAHVAAAASAVPAFAALALLTKLARVALLPIAIMIGTPREGASGPAIPGLAIAFFVASLAGSLPGWVLPDGALADWYAVRDHLLYAANVTLAIAMAAIGLRLSPKVLFALERGSLRIAVLGSLAVLAAVSIVAVVVHAA